jgi:hypothetical protein
VGGVQANSAPVRSSTAFSRPFFLKVVPFSKDRHDHALILAAETLGLDPARCISAWEVDYHNRIRGRSGDIAAQLRSMADAQGTETDGEQLGPVMAA